MYADGNKVLKDNAPSSSVGSAVIAPNFFPRNAPITVYVVGSHCV